MTFIRLWLIWLSVATAWIPRAAAQQSTGESTGGSSGSSSASGSTSSGASSAFGTSSSPAPSPFGSSSAPPSGGPAGAPVAPGAGGSATGFGTGIGTGTPATTGQPSGTAIPEPVKPLDSGPTTFSISTAYGKAAEVFVSGEGRLARPRFAGKVSASIGFDDNIFQTPTDAEGTPDVVIEQQVSAGTEAQIVLVPVKDTRPRRIGIIAPPQEQRFRRVVIPAEEPQFTEIVIPGTPKPKRQASAISRESLFLEAQMASRRTVFTFDFNANTDYYWNRPGKKSEYNGSLAIRYLHRFTPRLQVTASLDSSYLSQPDLTQINTPTNTGNGNYLNTTSKVDLSYRWAPRFSTVASLTYNQLSFEEELRKFGDYSMIGGGLALNYLWSPRITAVLEGRYGHTTYPNNSSLDSTTYAALIGLDWSLSRRAAATIRVGEALRTFDESGTKASAPYLETTFNYQLGKASVLSWSNRFGFEEPPDPNTEVLTFRSNLAVTHFFSARLRGSLSINAVHRSTDNSVTDTKTTDDTLDTAMSFYYTLTRQWNFNLSYSYTTVFFDPNSSGNYFRDHVFAGFDYAF